jgi:nucleoside-diphosphate-sugar epimerase
MTGKIVIAGASGIVGRAVVDHFEAIGDWDIVGVGRRPLASPGKNTGSLVADLANGGGARDALASVRDATHLVYCALFEKSDLVKGWMDPDQRTINRDMFVNFLDALLPNNEKLRHVSLLQGTKAYGVHLGPTKIPGREIEPRHIHPNFYWLQEDALRERQRGASWRWTIFRPQTVFGFGLGSPMNLLSAIAVYASISQKLGLPLVFPGMGRKPAAIEATDARLQARAIAWAGQAPAAENQTFNVTNGDVVIWEHLWPEIAGHFHMEIGARHPMSLAAVMTDKEPVWTEIQREHGLERHAYTDLVGRSWQFADMVLGVDEPSIVSTIKIRKAGFHDCIDTVDMLSELFDDLQRRKIIPDPASF